MATFFHLFNDDLFTSYDVRGVALKEITQNDAFYFGLSFGLFLNNRRTIIKKLFGVLIGEKPKVVVGCDGKKGSEILKEKFVEGLIVCGVNVVDIDIVPVPVVYYSVSHFDCEAGASISGSDFNKVTSIKFLLNDEPLTGVDIEEFTGVLKHGVTISSFKKGVINEIDIVETYITEVLNKLKFNPEKKLKVGIDCLNGSASIVLEDLVKRLPFKVLLKNINLEKKPANPDQFLEENIQNIHKFIEEEDLDFAFNIDTDGKKVVGVTRQGKILYGDDLFFIIAQDYLKHSKNKGIVLDLAFGLELEKKLIELGGKMFYSASGGGLIREKMRKVKAGLGLESRGHIYIKDEFYGYDDGIFAILKIISILSFEPSTMDDIANILPFAFKTKEIRIKTIHENEKFESIKSFLIEKLKPEKIIEEGGIKMIFEEGKAAIMVRVCNTEDAISFKAEAKNIDTFTGLEKLLAFIKQKFF